MKLLSLVGQLLQVKRFFQGHIGEVPFPNFIFDWNSIPLQDDENEADEVSESYKPPRNWGGWSGLALLRAQM